MEANTDFPGLSGETFPPTKVIQPLATAEAPKQKIPGWIGVFNSIYGPYAFGVTSLLLVWFFIVAPQLERSQIDHEAQLKSINAQKEASMAVREASRSLESISQSVERTAMILERTVDRMDKMNGD